MANNRIPNPSLLTSTAVESEKEYRKEIIEGQFMENIINKIESSALDGFRGMKMQIHRPENLKDFEIAMEELQKAGYFCEIKTETKKHFLFKSMTVTERNFIVRWD